MRKIKKPWLKSTLVTRNNEKSVSLEATGDWLTFNIPDDDGVMAPNEAFLAACFTLWISSQGGEDKAVALRLALESFAALLVSESAPDTTIN